MTLTDEQVEAFERDGVLLAEQVLTADDLAAVIAEIGDWVDARARHLHAKGRITDLAEDEPFERRYARLFEQAPSIGVGMDIMFMQGPALFDFLSNPRLLDTVQAIVGPEITCNPIQHLRAKPPTALEGHDGFSFHVVPWHQDAGVMMAEAEDSNIVSCWIPLVDVTPEMGPLRVLPGQSTEGFRTHVSIEGETMIDPDLVPDVEPRQLPCRPGDVILMNRFTPHSSTPNHSDRCRWSLDLRFQTTGHHTGRTAHPDFVVRSADPAAVTVTHETWKAAWTDAFTNPRGESGHRIGA